MRFFSALLLFLQKVIFEIFLPAIFCISQWFFGNINSLKIDLKWFSPVDIGRIRLFWLSGFIFFHVIYIKKDATTVKEVLVKLKGLKIFQNFRLLIYSACSNPLKIAFLDFFIQRVANVACSFKGK